MNDTPSNAAQLRDAIDHGDTADKVDHPDPAATPLGTDDEASGHPVAPEQAREAAREEVAKTAPAPSADHEAAIPRGVLIVIACFAVVILLGIWALI